MATTQTPRVPTLVIMRSMAEWDARVERTARARPARPFAPVVDTDALLSSIDNELNTGWPSYLRRLHEHEHELLASTHVYGEVYRRLPKIARYDRDRLEEMRVHWEDRFLPMLRFVNVTDRARADPGVTAVIAADATDAPTAALALLMAPTFVLSGDRHLRSTGFAPDRWLTTASCASSLDTIERQRDGTMHALALPVLGAATLLRAGAVRLRIPSPVAALGLTAVAGLWLYDPERRHRTWGRLKPFLELLAEVMNDFATRENAARTIIDAAAVVRSGPRTLEQAIASTLLAHDGPVGTPTLHRLLRDVDDVGFELPSLPHLRSTLRADPAFLEWGNGRWTLGFCAGPLDADSREQVFEAELLAEAGRVRARITR